MNLQSNTDGFELLSILLVSHGSGGAHLLFKYPFVNEVSDPSAVLSKNKKNPYSFVSSDKTNWLIDKEKNLIDHGLLCGLNNDVLAALCIMNKDKLELKIDNVFFLSSQTICRTDQSVYNVVFAVRSPLPRPVIQCYQVLSLSIAKALLKEEANANYLSNQAKILNDFICEHQNLNDKNPPDIDFSEAFQISTLGIEFKEIYESIRRCGVINLLVNNCTKLSFCLPHLAYKISEKHDQTKFVDIIYSARKYLKPYFGFLLLVPRDSLLASLPANCNFNIHRLIELYMPSFCMTRYAAELDVPIEEVYDIVDHLIHWAKIKIIYPITETNVYVIDPNAALFLGSSIQELFNKIFPNESFYLTLSAFSYSRPLVEHLDPRQPKEKHVVFVNMLIWFLQQNALIQLHMFLYLLPRKTEHHRLYSKISDLSVDEESEVLDSRTSTGGMVVVGAITGGSEHSNDTENTDQKDLSAIYDEYRDCFNDYNICEKIQQYIFKAFEHKTEADIKLFIQLLPYYDGTHNIESIIYYEKLNRSDMMVFLDKFKDLLIVTEYEDPNPLIQINSKIH